MIHAQADTMEAFKLSIWFETTKAVLHEAAKYRDMAAFRRGVIRMDAPQLRELPAEARSELDNLYALAVARTGAGAA